MADDALAPQTGPIDDVEVPRDLDFQRREWRAQRAGWAAMALVLLAALAGLFGSGPLSNTSAEAGLLRLDYARFERRHAPTELVVEAGPGVASGSRVEIWLPVEYVARLQVDSIQPEPDQVRQDGDRMVYAFAIDDPSSATNVTFSVEHDEGGSVTGAVGVVGGPDLTFWQFVYP